ARKRSRLTAALRPLNPPHVSQPVLLPAQIGRKQEFPARPIRSEHVVPEDALQLGPEVHGAVRLLSLEAAPLVRPEGDAFPLEVHVADLEPEHLLLPTAREQEGRDQLVAEGAGRVAPDVILSRAYTRSLCDAGR